MPKKYNFQKIEKKWQKIWEKEGIYKAKDKSKKEKKYVLVEFPYPSGEGLHMGHLRPYVAGDACSRYLRMKGYEVMYPIGWDAFGLPAENFAIKKGIHPSISTAKNIKNAKEQVKSWGIGFDWSREVNTTDPKYYKWTQWIFLQFFKAGLAYESKGTINWCPNDKTGLANEEVVAGKCERCGAVVEQKEMKQWYLKITAYAEKLLKGLKNLNWPKEIKLQQENWIGKSEGALIKFPLKTESSNLEPIQVFTTRPDTLFGATYLVLSPEHPLVEKLESRIKNLEEVKKYVKLARKKTEEERIGDKEKTGVELKGIKAINPANKKEIPVWIADYVLSGYGTGAIMAVPAHDERDFEFAKKFKLEIKKVISPVLIKNILGAAQGMPQESAIQSECWIGEGVLINSGKFDGMDSEKAKWEITKFVGGEKKIQYHLRDWVFSRQRYWGEPIPLIHCEKCGVVAVPDKDLPVTLPPVKKYEPTGTGESPLAAIKTWVNVKCPECGGPGKRETNTMPQWAGSSWYYLRYTDPKDQKKFASPELLKEWLPVDVYFGGMEHTTLHLLYSRFWHQFLYDQKLVPTPEPYAKRIPHGLILGPDGEKMSKSRGNVVSPDEMVKHFGADALRMYEMFLGPHDATVGWNEKGILGVSRFLERVWKIFEETAPKKNSKAINIALNKAVKKVGEDLENYRFNTAISALMIFLNEAEGEGLDKKTREIFLKILALFAPHLSEELWGNSGFKGSIHISKWPDFDEVILRTDILKLPIQINGKVKDVLEVSAEASAEEIKQAALENQKVKEVLTGRKPKAIVYVPGRIINIVI